MKKTLLVVATEQEAPATLPPFVEELVTGMGIANTLSSLLPKLLSNKYDKVINIGIAGSFNEQFGIGTVCYVANEKWGDLGYDDNGRFYPFDTKKIINPHQNNSLSLPEVASITVQTASGSPTRIARLQALFSPDIENMEGAAVFMACLQTGIPFLSLRAISNKVEPRNKTNWNIPLALENLYATLDQLWKYNTPDQF